MDLRTYFLMRYFTPAIQHGMQGLAGAIMAAQGLPAPWIAFVSFTAPYLGGCSTNLLNDYFDRNVDLQIRPWRPIPSGKLGAKQTLTFTLILIALGFLLTISLYNITCLLLALLVAFSAISYDISKRKRYIMHSVLSLISPLSIVYGYAAASGSSLEPLPLVLIVGFMQYTETFSLSFFTSIPDAVGDAKGGAVTASVKLGERKVDRISFAFIIANLILGLLPFTLGYLNLSYLLIFLTTRLLLIGIRIVFIRNPSQRLADFVRNTYAFAKMGGLIAFSIGAIQSDTGMTFALLLCLLIISTPLRFYTSAFKLKY